MRFVVQLRVLDDDGEMIADDTIISFDKVSDRLEDIGLSLSESKDVLAGLQRPVVDAQLAAYLDRCCCEHCGRALLHKGTCQLVFHTLFGTLSLTSPRFYRCCRQSGESRTFSPLTALLTEHTAPELLYLETKWASLASYGMTVNLLKDVLPIERANISTVRRRLHKVAARAEAELGCEPPCLSDKNSGLGQAGTDPVIIGIDSGNVRNWYAKKRRFEVVVGKRFAKSQQIQRSKQGAHHLLQTRARTLDGTLHTMFEKWYLGMAANDQNASNHAMTA